MGSDRWVWSYIQYRRSHHHASGKEHSTDLGALYSEKLNLNLCFVELKIIQVFGHEFVSLSMFSPVIR